MKTIAAILPKPVSRPGRAVTAFTLIEMLVVLGIIGILAAVTMPKLNDMNRSNVVSTATQQLIADINLARLRAINNRTTVYMVFASSNVVDTTGYIGSLSTVAERTLATNLVGGSYTSYGFYCPRHVGDQPGQDYPFYIGDWKTLPDGVFIAPQKFYFVGNRFDLAAYRDTNRPFAFTNGFFRYPTKQSPVFNQAPGFPFLAFDSQGRLVSEFNPVTQLYEDAVIPLATGSIFHPRDVDGAFVVTNFPDVMEIPPLNSISNFNRVRVDWLTGRARAERIELQ